MDLATLLISHHVLASGSIRETARTLERPVSSVSAAFSRLQSHIAKPLTSSSGSRLMPTLEGRRLGIELARVHTLILDIAALGGPVPANTADQHAAALTVSLTALFRFLTVVRSGSIRSAAQKIGIGQPQLTRQIRALETSLQVDLLRRTAAGAIPTEAGKRLMGLAQELEACWMRIFDHAGERFRRVARTIRLGSVLPLGHESHIAKMLALLAAEWPRRMRHNPLFISSGNTEELLEGLGRHQYEMVLLDTADVPADTHHLVLSRSNPTLVARTDIIEACAGDPARLLTSHPLALTSLKSGLRQKFIALMEDCLSPEDRRNLTYIEVDSIPVIANLVIEHGYVALLPQWALRGIDSVTQAIVLPDRFGMQLTLAWSADNGAEVIEIVREILREGGLFTP